MAMGNLAGPLSSSSPASTGDGAGAGAEAGEELTPWPTKTISLAEDYRTVMAKRAVFQSIASMGLPAFTIHSVVRYSGRMVRGVKVPFVRTWVPIGVCLPPFGEGGGGLFANIPSSVSPSFHSSHTYSITRSKKP